MTKALLLLVASILAPQPSVRIQATKDPTQVEVSATLTDVVGLPEGKLSQEQGERLLRLALLHPETGAEGPAMLGNYERRQQGLRFTPRYPLTHGQRYRATLDLGAGRTATAEYRVPARLVTPPAVVEKVYPTAAELPANQLKFYVHFSRPMRESKDIFDQFQILDDKGKSVADPWRRTELWSADGKRLTLWIHPGRIKEGVNLREEQGPVLEPGRRYTLVVGARLLDAVGQPLGRDFTKPFRTTKPERARPRIEDWTVQPPQAGSKAPLTLQFPRPMDRALLDRFVRVLDDQGQPLAGRIEVGDEERSWRFHPEQHWKAVRHAVAVDAELEDLAGNTPRQLFDVDREAPDPTEPMLTISFSPRTK